jgi:hypothetical protein
MHSNLSMQTGYLWYVTTCSRDGFSYFRSGGWINIWGVLLKITTKFCKFSSKNNQIWNYQIKIDVICGGAKCLWGGVRTPPHPPENPCLTCSIRKLCCQALKYRSVTDIVRPIREIVRRREETTAGTFCPIYWCRTELQPRALSDVMYPSPGLEACMLNGKSEYYCTKGELEMLF